MRIEKIEMFVANFSNKTECYTYKEFKTSIK